MNARKTLLLSLLSLVISLPALAQVRPDERGRTDRSRVSDMASDVEQLVEDYARDLPRRDQRELRRKLSDIVWLFEINGFYPDGGRNRRPTGPLFCDTGNNQLIDGDGRLIHDFGNTSDCREAKEQVERGLPFCDYGDNTLYTPQGSLVHDFGNSSNCREAIDRVANDKPFCDFGDNTLRKPNGDLIHDFGNSRDCREAMERY